MIRRVEGVSEVTRGRNVRSSRIRDDEDQKHNRINGNLEYMKEQGEQKRKREQSQKGQTQFQTQGQIQTDEEVKRTDVNNADVNETKLKMEASGKIQDLRERLQGHTVDTIKSVSANRKKAIDAYKKTRVTYEKSIEEDDGER